MIGSVAHQTMARIKRSLLPPPKLRLSEWLESELRLPSSVSAAPGQVRLWPWQREIADAIGDDTIERVALVKPVRVGFTTLLTGAIGSFIANDPAPILALLPTEADCRDYVVSDIEPVFEATPVLRGALADDSEEGERNTLMSRRFAGGSLKIVAAKAPRNLRRHNVRVLLIDEADAMAPGTEGSSLLLAERRTLSFSNRKIVVGSTPLDASTSNILRAYAASDRRIFEIPCPHCGDYFELKWAHIEWPEGRPAQAYARCPGCKREIDEREKTAIVYAARWRATAPEVEGHAGFRLNALVSLLPNASWGRLAEEFLRAKDDSDELQVFVNTILAEGWNESAEEIDETDLAKRAEPFSLDDIPPEVLALTTGTDVQDDRLEVSFLGWTRDHEILVLGHSHIWGSPGEASTWAEHDTLIRARYSHPRGGSLRVDAAVVDSGDGDWTEQVYAYCFPRLRQGVMAGKGLAGNNPAIKASKSKVKGGRLFLIGVDTIKTTLIDRMARGRRIRFSDSLDPSYYEQLASERKVVRFVRGQPVKRFERKPGAAAEALDCLVYGYAARQAVTIPMDDRERQLMVAAAIPPASVVAPQAQQRAGWLGPRREGWIR